MRSHPSGGVRGQTPIGAPASWLKARVGSAIGDGVDGATGALRPRGDVPVRPDLSRPQPRKRLGEVGLLDQSDDPGLAQTEHVDQLGQRHHPRLPVGHFPDTT